MKKENLEQLDCFAQNQEVREAVSAKVSKSSEILPGMYVYADGLISAELIADRQVKAIVGYVKDGKVYVLNLDGKGTHVLSRAEMAEFLSNQNAINAAENKLYDTALERNVWFSTEPHTSPVLNLFMGDRYRGNVDNGNYVRPAIIL